MNYSDKIFEMLNIKPNERFKLRAISVYDDSKNGEYYITNDLFLKAVNGANLIISISDILNGRLEIYQVANEDNWDDDLYPWK